MASERQVLWGPQRGTVAAACIALTIVFVFGGLVSLNQGAPLGPDSWWHEAIGVREGTLGFFVSAMLAKIGSSLGAGICVAVIALVLWWRRQRSEALVLVVTALTAVAASELIKAVVERPRPIDGLLHPPGFSYPSGHSMGAAMLATALFFIITRSDRFRTLATPRITLLVGAIAAVWTLAMMWSRTAVHVHWVTDTIAGALLGWSVAILVRAIALGVLRRRALSRSAAQQDTELQ